MGPVNYIYGEFDEEGCEARLLVPVTSPSP